MINFSSQYMYASSFTILIYNENNFFKKAFMPLYKKNCTRQWGYKILLEERNNKKKLIITMNHVIEKMTKISVT